MNEIYKPIIWRSAIYKNINELNIMMLNSNTKGDLQKPQSRVTRKLPGYNKYLFKCSVAGVAGPNTCMIEQASLNFVFGSLSLFWSKIHNKSDRSQ